MLRKDYFVRQLEEFGKVLGTLLFLKKQLDWEKFEEGVAATALKFTSFNLPDLEKMDPDTFKEKVVESETLELDKKKILAALLYEKLEMYAALGLAAEQRACALKCLALYSFLQANQTENEFNLEVHYRLEYLKKVYPE